MSSPVDSIREMLAENNGAGLTLFTLINPRFASVYVIAESRDAAEKALMAAADDDLLLDELVAVRRPNSCTFTALGVRK